MNARMPIDWKQLAALAQQWSTSGAKGWPEDGYQAYRAAWLERLEPEAREEFERRWGHGYATSHARGPRR